MEHELPISKLHRGDRFFLLLEITGRRIYGTVLQITSGSALVKLDARGEAHEFARLNRITGDYDTVKVPPKAKIEYWSLETPVFAVTDETPEPQLALEIG